LGRAGATFSGAAGATGVALSTVAGVTTGAGGGAATGGAVAKATPALGRAALAGALPPSLRDSQKVKSEAAAAEAIDHARTKRLPLRLTARKSAASTTLRSAERYGGGAERGALSDVMGANVTGCCGMILGAGVRSGCSGDKSKLIVAAGRS
jgi:hypothetical protein